MKEFLVLVGGLFICGVIAMVFMFAGIVWILEDDEED